MLNEGLSSDSSNENVNDAATKNNLSDYMENTTIHGIKYMNKKQQAPSEKLFWMIIIITCIGCMGFFISEVVIKWQNQTVILVEDEEPTAIFNIPFPAVTLCPQVKLKTEYFRYSTFGKVMNDIPIVRNFDNDPDYIRKLELAQLVCHPETTVNFNEAFLRYNNKRINTSHIELLHRISPTKSDVFDSIQYPMDCESTYFPNLSAKQTKDITSILTNEGVCFTFNVPSEIIRSDAIQTDYMYYNISNKIQNWNYETGYEAVPSFPFSTCVSGFISSLRLQIKSATADINTLCQPTIVGYKVILHSPTAYPNTFEDYISVGHNTITKIGVQPQITTTSKSLRSYSPKQRQCYFNEERMLKYFSFYNRANCKLECFANFTIENYGCVHFALPAAPNIPICGAIWPSIQFTYEMGDNSQSILDYIDNFQIRLNITKNTHNKLTCDCLPECNSIHYEYTTSVEPYEYDKLHNEIYDIFKENGTDSTIPTKIFVYLKDFKIVGKTRKQLYTFADLVSNFGGLLGLFMGGSVLSIVEILYFCIIRKYAQLHAMHTQRNEEIELENEIEIATQLSLKPQPMIVDA